MARAKRTSLVEKVNAILGTRVHRWNVLGPTEGEKIRCRCECGSSRMVSIHHLTAGVSRSCGCYQRERASTTKLTHGSTGTYEHRVWAGIKSRCLNPRVPCFKYYGGRGITICDRWRCSFEAFLEDMGRAPTAKHSIERIDNDGRYEPSNCRWATQKEQGRNRRGNRLITFAGETLAMAEWADRVGLSQSCLRQRLDKCGWPIEKALTAPPRHRGKV